MDNDSISIVIPVHNDADRLGVTVDALDALSSNLEVIIVDDGSTDGSASAIADIVRLHSAWRSIHIENCGPSAARNAGARASTGEFLVFLDAGDEPVDDWVGSLSNFESDEVILVQVVPMIGVFGVYKVDPELRFLSGCFSVRRSAFEGVGGYDENLWFAENSDFVERIERYAAENGFSIVATDVANIRRNDMADQRVYDRKRLDAMEYLLVRDAKRLESCIDERERCAAIGAVAGFRIGQWRRSLRLACIALRARPWRLDNWARLIFIVIPPLGRHRWPRNHAST